MKHRDEYLLDQFDHALAQILKLQIHKCWARYREQGRRFSGRLDNADFSGANFLFRFSSNADFSI